MSIKLLNFAAKLVATGFRDSHATEREEARIDVDKPYKPRKLKPDNYHKMMRQAYEHKPHNTTKEQEHKRTRKKWVQHNKNDLEKRALFVRKQKKLLNLD